jgi:hypothetical protein
MRLLRGFSPPRSQEVIDTGHGTNWGSKVRAIPARAFHLIGTRIEDGMVLRAPDAAAGSGINSRNRVPHRRRGTPTDG